MWNDSTITDAGRTLIARSIDGETLTITRARIGSGTVQATKLHSQTNVSNPVKYVNISEQKRVNEGVECSLIVTPEANEFVCRQVGLFAAIDDEAEVMIAIYQDNTGFIVPADVAEFMYKFNAIIAVDESADIVVTVDTSAFITAERLETVTAELRGEIAAVRATANGKQDAIADLSDIRSGVNNASNPNLLDNWYFARAVNQRNISGYSTTTRFFVDRWFADDVDCVFCGASTEGTGYISIKAKNSTTVAINQYIPRILRPGKYTASWVFINTVGSQLHTATIDYTNDGAWHSAAISTVSGTVVKMRSNTLNTTRTEFRIERTTTLDEQFGIVAVKLEIGDKQTLAHSENGKWVMNEIPDYGEQLRRCQRYYYRSWGTSSSTAVGREGSLSFTAGTTWSTPGVIEYPVEMHNAPSVILYNPATGATGSIRNWAKNTDMVATTTYANNRRCAITNADGKIVIGECYAFHYEAIVSGYGG